MDVYFCCREDKRRRSCHGWQTRDNYGGGEGEGDGNGDGKCPAAAITGLGERPPLAVLKAVTAAALVLAAEAVTVLKVYDANDSDGSVALVGCTSLVTRGGLIN